MMAASRGEARGRRVGKDKRRIRFDPYRSILFPNALRVKRREAGYSTLLQLSAKIADIPYIRLSKIERGEVFARSDELVKIAGALDIAPDALLLDVDAAGFSVERWSEGAIDQDALDPAEEEFAVLLAAALRVRRAADKALTIAVIENEFGLPPVMLSRIENALKVFDRWNHETQRALCRLFDVPDKVALRKTVSAQFERGELDAALPFISSPELRLAKTRSRIAELRRNLAALDPQTHIGAGGATAAPLPPPSAVLTAAVRLLPVFGTPLTDGLTALHPTGDVVEAPRRAGARAFGLRIFRPVLGAGLPPQSVLIVDPDRYPSPGGLAAVRDEQAYRILAVSLDRAGALIGYSLNPEYEMRLDEIEIGSVAAVVGALYP